MFDEFIEEYINELKNDIHKVAKGDVVKERHMIIELINAIVDRISYVRRLRYGVRKTKLTEARKYNDFLRQQAEFGMYDAERSMFELKSKKSHGFLFKEEIMYPSLKDEYIDRLVLKVRRLTDIEECVLIKELLNALSQVVGSNKLYYANSSDVSIRFPYTSLMSRYESEEEMRKKLRQQRQKINI